MDNGIVDKLPWQSAKLSTQMAIVMPIGWREDLPTIELAIQFVTIQ
jgi:hypothetical protein